MLPTKDTSQTRPDDLSAPNEKQDGVISDNFATNAWSTMSGIIHEVDERKIKGYKEDIDTFLVFAGLFSAVLTAFLVESYQGLQQDPSQVMIALMQQVVIQTYSYSLNAGLLNSTAPPLSQPLLAFQPSLYAVRVNILWFASLTLTLISASFGILVKQWLREYLAGDYTSPQARLRVRHYRNPGLDNWKVFEIAAMLPLLLQLALALFFIGLCFFTAGVHTTVGHTTLPLVAGWGFLFISAAFAPAFSPRCPYKTTLLKYVMKAVRKQHLSLVRWLRTAFGRLNRGLRAPHATGACHSRGSQTELPIPGKWPYEDPAYDEEVAAKTDNNDLDILITVDSIQSDDDLLRTMMATLQQSQVARTEYVKFALAIIGHRMQDDNITIPSSGFLDLLRLPKQAALTIMVPIAEILRDEIKPQLLAGDLRPIEWHDWMKDCLSLLFARTNTSIPTQAHVLFSSLLTDESRRKTFFDVLKLRAGDMDAVPHILERLQGTLVLMDSEASLLVLYHLVQQYFSPESSLNFQAFLETLKNPAKVPPEYLQFFVDTLVILVEKELPDPVWSLFTGDKIILIIELWSQTNRLDRVPGVFQSMLSSKRLFTALSMFAMGLNRGVDSSSLKEGAQKVFINVILAASRGSELRKILESFIWALEYQWKWHLEASDDSRSKSIRLDPLKSCHMLLRSLSAMRAQGLQIDDHADLIHRIWSAVDKALPLVSGRHIQGHAEIAKDCLKLVDSLDISQPPDDHDTPAYTSWAQNFAERTSLFPDTLIERLMLFLASDEDATTFSHRVRRLAIIEYDSQSSLSAIRRNISRPLNPQDMLAQLSRAQALLESSGLSGDPLEDRITLLRNRVRRLQVEIVKESEALPPGLP